MIYIAFFHCKGPCPLFREAGRPISPSLALPIFLCLRNKGSIKDLYRDFGELDREVADMRAHGLEVGGDNTTTAPDPPSTSRDTPSPRGYRTAKPDSSPSVADRRVKAHPETGPTQVGPEERTPLSTERSLGLAGGLGGSSLLTMDANVR